MNKVGMSWNKKLAYVSIILGCCVFSSHTAGEPEAAALSEKTEIVIIGAGLSGLVCAFDLEEILTNNDLFDQCNITLCEARGRTGGRLFTVTINGRITEMGGYNLKDGFKAEHVKGLIEELGLTVVSYYKKRDDQWKCTKYFDGEKFIFTKNRLKKCNFDLTKLQDQLNDLAEKCTCMKEVIDILFDDPILRIVFAAKISDYEGAPVEKLSARCIDTLEYHLRGALNSAYGTNDTTMVPIEYVEGGNALITERLAEKLQSKIYLNMPLSRIEKDAESGRYVLHFATGEIKEADIVILTMPCPVYKDIVFADKVIPESRLTDIANVEYSTNAKIVVPVVSAKKGAGTSYTNGRATLRVDDQSHLTIYYINNNGKFSPETIESHLKKDRSFVESSYNLAASLPEPVCAQDKQFVDYEGPVGHSWPNDPYVKGSYSCIGAGKEDLFLELESYRGETVKSLFSPIDDSLFFTGEHTTILSNIDGTIEAAAESGRRIARIVGNVVMNRHASLQ